MNWKPGFIVLAALASSGCGYSDRQIPENTRGIGDPDGDGILAPGGEGAGGSDAGPSGASSGSAAGAGGATGVGSTSSVNSASGAASASALAASVNSASSAASSGGQAFTDTDPAEEGLSSED